MLQCYSMLLFQSAPLTDVRGDVQCVSGPRTMRRFQSAPLTDVRGDSAVDRGYSTRMEFQSAPLTDVRGDARADLENPPWPCFNPLPSLM